MPAWVIPILIAYIPGVGDRVPRLHARHPYRAARSARRRGVAEGQWPPVTLVIAAWNEEDAIVRELERIAELATRRVQVVLADNDSTDRTAELAGDAASAWAWTTGGSSSPSRASTGR